MSSQTTEVTGSSDNALSFQPRFFGARTERREDAPLLSGRGQYIADLTFSGMVEAHFVRSTVAHARIVSVNLDAVRRQPGVLWAGSASDLEGLAEYPERIVYQQPVHQFALQRDIVRYVGAPVAVIVATDRYVAEDAAEYVEIVYDELPTVTTLDEALAPDAPILFEGWRDNRQLFFPVTNPEIERIFAEFPTVSETYVVQRQAAVPMETRGVVADYQRGRLSVWSPTQNAHMLRTTLSEVLAIPERTIHVMTPDVGGSFGAKIHAYPEDMVVPYLAMKLGRPVRFIEDRAEHMVSSVHARDQRHEMTAAYDPEGRIMGVRAHVICDVGSGETSMTGTGTAIVTAASLTSSWKIPCSEVSISCVVTNKTPSGAYRGYGGPEAVFAMERMIDKVAWAAGVDPREARRKMMFNPEDMPYTQPNGARIDSGSHKAAFERALVMGQEALERRQREGVGPRLRLGMNCVQFVEPTAPVHTGGYWNIHDAATLRVDQDGGVLVACGVAACGQGTESTIAALTADVMNVPIEQVTVLLGDTDSCPYGLGSWGSRSAVVFAGAIEKASALLREKGKAIAAGMLEADPNDMVVEDGAFHVAGSAVPALSWADVAKAAYARTFLLPEGIEPNLEAAVTYAPPNIDPYPDAQGRMNGAATWGNASHSAVVSVDLDTGVVEILDYFVVCDCGRVINPNIVDGQVQGGVAQGVAGALYEMLPYDTNGQPLATSFMDYVIPSATDVPHLIIEHMESLAPEMPFGIKGVGEGGAIGPPATIAGAVVDALSEFGIDITETPITPGLILRLLRAKSLSVEGASS